MERTDFGRIVAFTDGVMAVAITLLVLNIEAPTVDSGELGEALVDLLPSLYAYVLSFALIGRFWVIHHNLFHTLTRFNGRLMALNLLFLLLIVILPFATDLLDRYDTTPLANAVFGTVLALVALVHWSMTHYSLRMGFVHADHVEDTQPFGSPVAFGFGFIFLLSVPLAFIAVELSHALWLSTFVLRYPLRRLARWVSR